MASDDDARSSRHPHQARKPRDFWGEIEEGPEEMIEALGEYTENARGYAAELKKDCARSSMPKSFYWAALKTVLTQVKEIAKADGETAAVAAENFIDWLRETGVWSFYRQLDDYVKVTKVVREVAERGCGPELAREVTERLVDANGIFGRFLEGAKEEYGLEGAYVTQII